MAHSLPCVTLPQPEALRYECLQKGHCVSREILPTVLTEVYPELAQGLKKTVASSLRSSGVLATTLSGSPAGLRTQSSNACTRLTARSPARVTKRVNTQLGTLPELGWGRSPAPNPSFVPPAASQLLSQYFE